MLPPGEGQRCCGLLPPQRLGAGEVDRRFLAASAPTMSWGVPGAAGLRAAACCLEPSHSGAGHRRLTADLGAAAGVLIAAAMIHAPSPTHSAARSVICAMVS